MRMKSQCNTFFLSRTDHQAMVTQRPCSHLSLLASSKSLGWNRTGVNGRLKSEGSNRWNPSKKKKTYRVRQKKTWNLSKPERSVSSTQSCRIVNTSEVVSRKYRVPAFGANMLRSNVSVTENMSIVCFILSQSLRLCHH